DVTVGDTYRHHAGRQWRHVHDGRRHGRCHGPRKICTRAREEVDQLHWAAVAVVRHPKPGTVLLGKYRVDSVVGEGGMGAVVKAWHLDLEESVALKILLPEMMDRPEIVVRFMREAKAAVKLK